MDIKIASRFYECKDFYEGVGAIIVRKDKRFTWSQLTVDDVPKELIEEFFNRPEEMNLDLERYQEGKTFFVTSDKKANL